MKKFIVIIISTMLLLTFFVSNGSSATASHSKESVRSLIYSKFGNGWLGREMVCIADRESNLEHDAWNRTDKHWDNRLGYYIYGSFGLFQLGALHRRDYESVTAFRIRMFQPKENVQRAYELYKSSGLSPWGGGC